MYINFLAYEGYDYADTYLQSSWEDVALEVTVSSVKSTDVTYKTRKVNWPCNCRDKLIWRRLCAIWTSSSVVDLWLCSLWSLVRSPGGGITVYNADET